MKNKDFFPFCIYTLKKTSELEKALKNNTFIQFTESKRWVTGSAYAQDAMKNDQDLLILFAPAGELAGPRYAAVIHSIEVGDESGTKYTFRDLVKLPREIKKSELKLKNGNPLSEDFIRPYALCRTPAFIADWF